LSAFVSGSLACLVIVRTLNESESPWFWLTVSSTPAILCCGACFWWYVRQTRFDPNITPTIWMHTAYLAHATPCLSAMSSDRQIGWWLTAMGSCGLLVELSLVLIGAIQRRRRLSPLA
jgi:hypothetical protein